jgi:hypothetical protein
VNDNLGVSIGVKTMAAGLEAQAQLRKIINLSVKDDPYRLIFIVDWLAARREINDAQPPHAQAGTATGIDSLVVRPPMHDRLAHTMDIRRIDCVIVLNTDNTCYSTHGL